MIYFLVALTAFSSFVNEVNLAQTLSGALGGTILRYHTGFGLFTCFLGLGSWAFDGWNRKWSSRRLLIASQILLIVTGLAGPYWIRFFNPLLHDPRWNFVLTAVCYAPLVLTAFCSGLELPAWMKLGSTPTEGENLFALGWDYVGMFAASLIYPLVLLYHVGVFGSAWCAASVNLTVLIVILILSLKAPASSEKAEHHAVAAAAPDELPLFLCLFLLFLFSFCSMSFELLTAKTVSDFISDEVLGQSASVGLFLIGLGAGTFHAAKVRAPKRALIVIESMLTAVGTAAFLLISAISTLWLTEFWIADRIRLWHGGFEWLVPVAFLIGYLSGFELPLLLRLRPRSESIGRTLSFSYAGALVSGFVVPLLLLPHAGVAGGFIVTASLNLAGLALLLIVTRERVARFGWLALLLLGIFIHLSFPLDRKAEQVFLKSYYFKLRLMNHRPSTLSNFFKTIASTGPIQRITSRYQFIDLVTQDASAPLFKQNTFTLYLNRQPQFTSNNWKTYHDSLIYGAFNLAEADPSSVLILGGGDGILASRLLHLTHVKKITLVELDPMMIRLARSRPEMLALNHDVFSDPRVHLVIDDAFRYLHRTSRRYGAVFVDFPYPTDFELTRIFSVEFYRALRARLSPNGFIAMDAPIWHDLDDAGRDLKSNSILFNTLSAAGFASIEAFGPIEPFIVATPEARDLRFHYDRLPADLPDRVFVNLTSLDFLVKPWKHDARLINSIYAPRRFLN